MDRKFRVNLKDENGNHKWGYNFETYQEAETWAIAQLQKPGRMQQPIEDIIVDLSKDNDWVLKNLREKRSKEYPSEIEIIEALMEEKEGRPEKLSQVLQKRDEIKKKYPISDELKKGR